MKESERKEGKDREGELEGKEVERVLRLLKDGKATGEDEIPNEVWKYKKEGVRSGIWEICRKVWKGEQ